MLKFGMADMDWFAQIGFGTSQKISLIQNGKFYVTNYRWAKSLLAI